MKVIILKQIPKLGNPGDIIDVAPSYARNFLLPRGLARLATVQALATVEIRRSRQQKQQRQLQAQNAKSRNILEGQTILVRSNANPEGKLFGGVDAQEIAKNIAKRKKIEVDSKQIILPRHLKTLGRHEVMLKLRGGEEVGFFVEIERESNQ